MSSTIVLSAGEASGDVNGACLVAELKRLRPDLAFWGAGGPKMRDAGVDISLDMTGGGTIGLCATMKSLRVMLSKYLIFRRKLLRRPPDLFIPIDFGAFNLRLAQVLRRRGVPVVYYFPPSSWRRRPRNAAKLLAAGGKVITPFAWSAESLCAAGLDARWVGHPIVDIAKPTVDRAAFLRELGLDESLPVIGLLPGSRGHELAEHLPPMIGCAEIISRELPGAQFVVAVVGSGQWVRDRIDAAARRDLTPTLSYKERETGGSSCEERAGVRAGVRSVVRVVENRTYDAMAACEVLISKSGTATLEAAVIGTPMVIVYRGTPVMRLEYRLRKGELEDFIGMPNIVADRGVCPELINEDVTAEKMADIALSILRDEGTLARMRESLAEVRRSLGEPGAVERAARVVLEMGGLA